MEYRKAVAAAEREDGRRGIGKVWREVKKSRNAKRDRRRHVDCEVGTPEH